MNSIKVRDHGHLTVKYIGPLHDKLIERLHRNKAMFFLLSFNIFCENDCNLFFKKLIDNKKIKKT